MEFKEFSDHINAKFNELAQTGLLLRTNISKEAIWDTYINAFPEGTDPLYITETEHTCNCCKSFLRQIAGVVIVYGGVRRTLWDDWDSLATPYREVACALEAAVNAADIETVFKPGEPEYGAQITYTVDSPEKPRSFEHFYCTIPQKYTVANHAALNSTANNFTPAMNSLVQIKPDAVQTVIDLIGSDSLYRGDEHLGTVSTFQTLLEEANEAPDIELFVWERISNFGLSIRNTAIGSLLMDLSKGKDLEKAVASFEAKVAPENYKRTKSLITQPMIDKATATIHSEGLETALPRRHARPADINVSDILYVDRTTDVTDDGPLAMLKPQKKKPARKSDNPNVTPIEEFLVNVLPKTKSLKVMFEGKHTNNLVNILTAADQNARALFKWDNHYSWSYNGSIADSAMRAAVISKGGRIGDFRFSHSWNHNNGNESLMDLHVFMPGSGTHQGSAAPNDFYPTGRRVGWNSRKDVTSGGVQDVDYVHQANMGEIPVENITFPDINKMPEGVYSLKIHNWHKRGRNTEGFKAEIEFQGQIFMYDYPKSLGHKEWVDVANVTLKNGVFTIKHLLPHDTSTQTVWGLNTEEYHEVSLACLSPNFWREETGNKHYMFMLKNCLNPDPARAIYNEFLRDDLVPHRKVFEVLGSQTLCPPSNNQLAGLGFSSTKREQLSVLADGRPYTLQI